MRHVSFTGASLGPFQLHSCPRGMSRGKQTQQSWAWGQSRHVFAVFRCRDFAEISAERKKCCRMARIFAVPIFGTSKPEKTSFFCVIFFGTSKPGFRTPRWVLNRTQLRSEWASCLPMGAEWDAIAIRMSPCALRWVRKRIQIRSKRFPMHHDVCGMRDPVNVVR